MQDITPFTGLFPIAENARVKKLHLTEMEGRVYKVFGIVTNIEDLGRKLENLALLLE